MRFELPKIALDIQKFLESRGYVKDSFGNYKITKNGRVYRFKFQDKSLRHEVQYVSENKDYPNSWVRLSSEFYSKLSLSEKGIKGMKIGY